MKDPKNFKSIHDLPLIFHDVMKENEIELPDLQKMTREEIVEMQVMWKLGTTQWYDTFKYWLHKAGLKIVESENDDK